MNLRRFLGYFLRGSNPDNAIIVFKFGFDTLTPQTITYDVEHMRWIVDLAVRDKTRELGDALRKQSGEADK